MRTRSCIAALLLAAASTALPCRYAAADDKDAVTEMAKRRFQEGVKFFDQKRYEEARAAFLQAYALKHHPAVLLNLAQCELRSGHNLEAARHFTAYLRDPPPNAGGGMSDAEKGLASARTKLGRIQVSVASGADVLVDGESVGQAPLPEAVDAAPGNHTVEARLGGRSTSTSVTVSVGKSATATLSLEGGGAATLPVTAPPTGSTPPATAPSETPEVPPPSDVAKDGSATADTSMQLSTSGRDPFFKWLGHSGVGLVGVSLTGIGLGVGIGFSLAAKTANDHADSVASQIEFQRQNLKMKDVPVCGPPALAYYQNGCNALNDNIDKRDTDKTIATVGFAAAGVGFATIIIGYLASSKTSSGKAVAPTSKVAAQAPGAVLVPVIGAHESGLQIIGRF